MLDRKSIIEDLTRWIDMNLDSRLNVETIAERSGYTKWHIQRMFSEVNKISVISYIRMRLLEKAAADLIQSDDNITEVALRNGFGSQQAFSRAFKKSFKIGPGAYRTCVRHKAFSNYKANGVSRSNQCPVTLEDFAS